MSSSTHGELNLVPYLDIVTTLTILFLAITAYAAEAFDLHRLDTDVPGYTPVGDGSPLRVDVEHDGFRVVSGDRVSRLPREADAYPYTALTRELRALRPGTDGSASAVVTASSGVPYATVVATLDAMRSDEAGAIFPRVALGAAVQNVQ